MSNSAAFLDPPLPKQRFLHADVIRAYATLAVVLLHAAVLYVDRWQQISSHWWWVGNVFHSLSRSAVPLFIMLSGALLLAPGKAESLEDFWRKRLAKLLVPFGLWSLVYLWLGQAESTQSVLQRLVGLLHQPAYGHLWFLYMILGLYSVTPLLRIFIRHGDRATLRYYLVLWFVFCEIAPFVNSVFHFSLYFQSVFYINGFIGLFLLGYFLDTVKLTPRLTQWAVMLVIGGWVATAVATATVMNPATGKPFDLVYEVGSPLVLGMSAGTFLLLKNLPHERWSQRAPWLYQAMGALSGASMTIYLAHLLPVQWVQTGWFSLRFDPLTMHPLWAIPLLTVANLLICLGLHQLLRRLPLGRWIAP
jgi:surface polysaccharide O-acyltransferase-like enzyme